MNTLNVQKKAACNVYPYIICRITRMACDYRGFMILKYIPFALNPYAPLPQQPSHPQFSSFLPLSFSCNVLKDHS